MRLGWIASATALAMAAMLATSAPLPARQQVSGDLSPEAPAWQLPDEAIGTRLSPILLLSRLDVRAELAITADQAEAAAAAIAGLQAQAGTLRGRSGPDAVNARRAVDEAAQRWIAEHLDSEQQSRLEQLDLQWEGASALVSRPTIAASLDLTDDQRRQVLETLSQGSQPGTMPVLAHHRLQRLAGAVLTEDQRLRWRAMLGPPFFERTATDNRDGGVR